MVALTSLVIPIVLSAVLVFVASSIVHMATPFHRGDWRRAPREGELQDAMRPFDIPPGDYALPCPGSMQQMRSKEFAEKMNRGPVVYMTVRAAGPVAMGKNLVMWFVYSLVVSVLAAYVAGRAVPAGTDYLQVFRFAGTTAFIAYTLALPQQSIWYEKNWATTIRSMIDGLLYGLLTAGVFGWLWPR